MAALALLLAAVAGASGCSTTRPPALDAQALVEAETFPYYELYWVGPRFGAYALTAVDGRSGYDTDIGDSVYYGDCVNSKGIFGSGTCRLPLQVTTVIYRLHSNAALGPQSNAVLRGVPATVYDGGRSIELYSGQTAIDIFSDSFAHAKRAAQELRPLNAPGSAHDALPLPVYCPGLTGKVPSHLRFVLDHLPGRACQRAAASEALARRAP